MRLPLFFITLCFILLRVGAPLHASVSTSARTGLAPAMITCPFSGTGVTSQQQSEVRQAIGDDKDLLVYDDEEDEDASELFARKFKFIAREYPELILLEETGCPINRSKAAPSFFGRVTYRYLLQRVFRV